MPPATRRESDAPPRLVVTVVFVAVALFIAAEPYLIPWANQGMQLFQGAIILFLWLLLMFGSPRRR
ncbi:MAG: hypothetical protein SF182_26565 [Deltaproteobacteria bacterium]|nr:hypothetical protein [Deltaproteobacteria bacterium]